MIKRFFSPPKSNKMDGKDQAVETSGLMMAASSSRHMRFGFWRDMPVARKLLLAFGALFAFSVIIAIVTLNGLNRTQSSYEGALTKGIEIRNVSNQLAINFSKAREDEKNFLLRWRNEGYDTAYQNYVTVHVQDVAKMRENLAQLSSFGPSVSAAAVNISQMQYEADLATLSQNVDTYEKNFTALVDAYHKKGFDEPTDFESQFRNAAQNLDSYLFYGGLVGGDAIKVTYLRIRLSEKNYLADAAQPYANDVHSLLPVLKDQIALAPEFKPIDKTNMLIQVEDYVAAFDGLVALDREIADRNKELITAAEGVQSLTAKFESLGEQLATDEINKARASNAQTFAVSIITVFGVLVLSILLAISISRQLTHPIISLTNAAQEISTGKFDAKARVNSADEIGTLAQTFNDMTSQLQGALQNLDHHAKELEQQTEQLELTSRQSNKRAQQLQTIAEIAGYISTEKDLNRLMPLITQTVSEQFGFYHVGIFLLDDHRKYAVLLASNSAGGQKMLQRHHRLEVGQTGIVGNVTATGVPRIALDTGTEAIYFNNPDLPDTRSELALPLKSEGQVIGALDIQSVETNAFSNEDVEALTILADQVSIAIQNARLLNQVEKALAESNAIQRQYIHETWMRLPKEEKINGYRYSLMGTEPLEETKPIEEEDGKKKDQQEVSVPIILRGETIGTLSVQVPGTDPIDPDQMDLIRAVAERVALSAENARLFEDTTRRAERERIVSEITSKIGTSVRTENILRTTAKELSQLLEDADIFINLQAASNGNGKDGAK